MHAHEAGALHSDGYSAAPDWLPWPTDLNALEPELWPRHTTRDADGALSLGGVDVRDLAKEFGTPAYILDEDDFRWRAKEFKRAYDAAFAPVCGGGCLLRREGVPHDPGGALAGRGRAEPRRLHGRRARRRDPRGHAG
ncbi:hypothetical protein GCM10025862_23280 [Arsenicicoccus piscis]|uniref:Uncharacterized protein n=1 Tax=Arsenicicoccus piscis TaxID=673954 RepID=A0ABQ6HPM4_9MICO|nr:hypothetical protein GCM10025862_23280 [Arsenicicoccus piscis]